MLRGNVFKYHLIARRSRCGVMVLLKTEGSRFPVGICGGICLLLSKFWFRECVFDAIPRPGFPLVMMEGRSY